MTGAACTNGNTSLNADDFIDNLHKLYNKLDSLHAPGTSLRVVENKLCQRQEPARQHKKHRNQTEAYHRRIQKKWTKRYGTKAVPCAVVIDESLLPIALPGWRGKTLIIHPSLMQSLRADASVAREVVLRKNQFL